MSKTYQRLVICFNGNNQYAAMGNDAAKAYEDYVGTHGAPDDFEELTFYDVVRPPLNVEMKVVETSVVKEI